MNKPMTPREAGWPKDDPEDFPWMQPGDDHQRDCPECGEPWDAEYPIPGKLTRERDEARALLREVEWMEVDRTTICHFCGIRTKRVHAPDCRLAAALKA